MGSIIRVDAASPLLGDYVGLTDVALRRRREPAEGLFIAESEKVVRRALNAGYPVRSLLLEDKWLDSVGDLVEDLDVPVYVGNREDLAAVTGYQVHRGVLAAMTRLPLPAVQDVVAGARRVVVLEDVVEHTNVGAAFRSAAGLGVDAVLVTPRCADPLYRRSVRVSMGTVFQVPWTRIAPWPEGIEDLRAAGLTTAALALEPAGLTLDELVGRRERRLALVVGTEGDGLSRHTVGRADLTVRIPMAGGVDSLNVAAAAAVACYALRPDPED